MDKANTAAFVFTVCVLCVCPLSVFVRDACVCALYEVLKLKLQYVEESQEQSGCVLYVYIWT